MPKDRDGPGAGGGSSGGRNEDKDWKGKPRSNATHASTTDPDARLFRKSKSQAAILAYQGHVLMENRKRIEEHFGWGKTVGRIRQTVYRGLKRVDQHFKLTMTASNIVRMARILSVVPQGATR